MSQRGRENIFFLRRFFSVLRRLQKEERFVRTALKTLLRTHFPSKKVLGVLPPSLLTPFELLQH